MQFHNYNLISILRERGLRHLFDLLCGSLGGLFGAVCGIRFSSLGVPFEIGLTVYLTCSFVIASKLFVWPGIERHLNRKDDKFLNKIYAKEVLYDRLETIRTADVDPRLKAEWSKNAHQKYFDELDRNEAEIRMFRIGSKKPTNIEEGNLHKSTMINR